MARLFFLFILGSALTSSAQKPIEYNISFPNALHHEAEIEMMVPDVPVGALSFRMSRSSPGRYATHEFGKNVYAVKAFNGQGKPLELNQIEGDLYQVENHDGTVQLTYTIFGDLVDGTYLAIDESHAHINMPATFMWVPKLQNRSISIKFNDLDTYGWKVATQLKPGSSSNIFTAPDLNYFMDSPIELSNFDLLTWSDRNTDNTEQTIRFSTHSSDSKEVISNFSKMVARTVKESKMVFGELPRFDYGNYTFLHDINEANAGDGMEHRNSTIITDKQALIAGNEIDLLGTFSHEFFHSWNVERIRPKSLEPFNFSHANMSSELWFAEGFTQYYGNLILRRAGFLSDNQYLEVISGILNGVLNSPGAASFSAREMSRRAVFVDAGVSVDRNNYANTFTSYYTYGAFIALGLDLRLRTEFNLTLDDYMQALWHAHGKTEIPYTVIDLQHVLSKLTNTAFADDFFSRYIQGTEKNDYVSLLSKVGLELRKAEPGIASIGNLRFNQNSGDKRILVSSVIIKGSPAYEAGIDFGDAILRIGDDTVNGRINEILRKYKPGQDVNITFEHKGKVKTSILKLQESNLLEVIENEKASQEQIHLRNAWLSSKNH